MKKPDYLEHFKRVDPQLYRIALEVGDITLAGLFHYSSITPEALSVITDDQPRSCGLSRSKISAIRHLSFSIIEKLIDIDTSHVDKLLTIKGIGPWTIEMFQLSVLGEEDIFSPGDIRLRNAIQTLYSFDHIPSRAEMEMIVKKWAPYRSYACRIL